MIKLRTALVAAAVALAACAPGEAPEVSPTPTDQTDASPSPEVASGSLMIYTSVPEPVINELKAEFEAAFPDLELEIFRAATSDVTARIEVEQQAGEVQADLIWVAEPSAYEGFKADDLLAPYAPPEDAPIPETFIDPDGFYVAGRVINMIVAWNTDELPEGLGDWPDLIEVADRAVFPPPTSGSVLAAAAALTDEFGDDFFERFEAAGGSQISSNGAARDALISGEFAAAGVLDYFIRQAKADGSPVDLVYPESGTVVIPSPIAMTASAQNPEGAKVFLDYLLSQEGQQAVVEIGGFYPVRDDVDAPEGAPTLDDLVKLEVDWVELVERTDEINADWRQIFGE
jgi:iron(III) transport system substrate-binding protein